MSLLVKQTRELAPANSYRIPLTHGLSTLVDPADFFTCGVWHWKAKKSAGTWYAVRSVIIDGKEKTIRLHRLLTNCPDGLEVHHKNHDSLDNRRKNLQPITPEGHQFLHKAGF